MAARKPKHSAVVLYGPRADQDYSEIYDSTVFAWGEAQAERYADMIDLASNQLANDPHWGKPIEGYPSLLAYFVKCKKAKHGHYIVYKPLPEGGIEIVRILHGRMDRPRRLQ